MGRKNHALPRRQRRHGHGRNLFTAHFGICASSYAPSAAPAAPPRRTSRAAPARAQGPDAAGESRISGRDGRCDTVAQRPAGPDGEAATDAKTLYPTDDYEALADLRDLVEGRGEFTIQYTDEYMEGLAPGVDRRLAQRLHRGDYAVQAHIDLHGHTVEEAKVVVERFVTAAYAAGQRCILLIHGRGLNSKDNRPVLKEQVRIWLSHGRLSRLVLAFATAPLTNGGAGAVYVLLRRVPGFQKK